jgi:BirA family biotin operon repressor/biotin-[acetyl-CoA-carboxylase] ligase
MNQFDTPLHLWADAIEEATASHEILGLKKSVVLAETGSTQDAAAGHAAGEPGLVCIAARQTGGRGRLGRVWADNLGKGISMTLVLRTQISGPKLSLAAGVAVAQACAEAGPGPRVGLRWPNDVVDRPTRSKIAGILIEKRDGLTLLGIGINTHQSLDDWQATKQATAISMHQLGAQIDRLSMIQGVLAYLESKLAEESKSLADQWHARDTLTGTSQTFEHNGKRITGLVESIDPTNTLIVRTTAGLQRLPAASTSLIHSEH